MRWRAWRRRREGPRQRLDGQGHAGPRHPAPQPGFSLSGENKSIVFNPRGALGETVASLHFYVYPLSAGDDSGRTFPAQSVFGLGVMAESKTYKVYGGFIVPPGTDSKPFKDAFLKALAAWPPYNAQPAAATLPGSQVTVDQIVNAATWDKQGVIMLAEAADEARKIPRVDAQMGHTPVYQSFKVLSVFRGKAQQDETIRVEYDWVELKDVHERALNKGERVVWLLEKTEFTWQGRKALADTPENRKAVAKAMADKSAAAPAAAAGAGSSLAEVQKTYAKAIEALLPKGWSLNQGEAYLQIVCDAPLKEPPVSTGPGPQKKTPPPSSFAITLAFSPPVSAKDLAKLRDENAAIEEKLAALRVKLEPFGHHKDMPNNPVEAALRTEYQMLEATLHRLPDYATPAASIALSANVWLHGEYPYSDEAIRKECAQVRDAVEALLGSEATVEMEILPADAKAPGTAGGSVAAGAGGSLAEVQKTYAKAIEALLPKGWSLRQGEPQNRTAIASSPIMLPNGWPLSQGEAYLQIVCDAPLAEPPERTGPGSGRVTQAFIPPPAPFAITLAFSPPISAKDLARFRDENAAIEKKLAALPVKLRQEPHPKTEPEDPVEAALRTELHRLPDYATPAASIAPSANVWLHGEYPYDDEAIRKECAQVRDAVDALLGSEATVAGAWGEPDQGLRMALRPVKREWKPGEAPRLLADISNIGDQSFNVFKHNQLGTWELQVDGQWSIWSGPVSKPPAGSASPQGCVRRYSHHAQ